MQEAVRLTKRHSVTPVGDGPPSALALNETLELDYGHQLIEPVIQLLQRLSLLKCQTSTSPTTASTLEAGPRSKGIPEVEPMLQPVTFILGIKD